MTTRKAKATADSLREWKQEKQRQRQIPCGNDNKKSKGNSRFPAGMTTRRAIAARQTRGAVAWGV
jgi:hypothetical protein